MVEDRYKKRSSLERVPRNPKRFLRFGGFRAPRFGPESVSRDLEGNSGDRKVQGGAEVEPGAGGTPVGESGTDWEAGGEEGAEVRRECEAELGFCASELSVGETLLDSYPFVAEMSYDFID